MPDRPNLALASVLPDLSVISEGFTPLVIEDLTVGGRPRLKLRAPLVFLSRVNGGAIRVTVPAGFVTDVASTPRVLWRIFPPMGRWNRAAVLHDYLYSLSADRCSRFLADALFREAMYRLGVPTWRRVLMYYAVRLFGWTARPKRGRATP